MCEFGRYFSLILAALFIFGVLYNLVIGWMERHGYIEGYVAVAVILGVLVTLAGVAMVDPLSAALCLAAFAASGLPMAGGSIWRHMKARKADRDAMRRGC